LVQAVIALIVTSSGFHLAYEVLPSNTCDKTTLRDARRKIEAQCKAKRIRVMDRGIPTEVLAEMRAGDPPVVLSGQHAKRRLSKLESTLLGQPWQAVRESCSRILRQALRNRSFISRRAPPASKRRAMRRSKLKWLWARLKQIAAMEGLRPARNC
jgi:hypothetical protein